MIRISDTTSFYCNCSFNVERVSVAGVLQLHNFDDGSVIVRGDAEHFCKGSLGNLRDFCVMGKNGGPAMDGKIEVGVSSISSDERGLNVRAREGYLTNFVQCPPPSLPPPRRSA